MYRIKISQQLLILPVPMLNHMYLDSRIHMNPHFYGQIWKHYGCMAAASPSSGISLLVWHWLNFHAPATALCWHPSHFLTFLVLQQHSSAEEVEWRKCSQGFNQPPLPQETAVRTCNHEIPEAHETQTSPQKLRVTIGQRRPLSHDHVGLSAVHHLLLGKPIPETYHNIPICYPILGFV